MGMKSTNPSDLIAVAGVVSPDALAAGDHSTGWINMAEFTQIMAVIQSGVLGASATLDAKLEQATDGAGTGVKDITGAAIAQLVKASNDNDQAVIEMSAEALDVDNSFTHARLTLTVGTATSDAGAVVLGCSPRFGPAKNYDLASVQEIVSV